MAWAEGQPFVGLGLDSVGWVELLMQERCSREMLVSTLEMGETAYLGGGNSKIWSIIIESRDGSDSTFTRWWQLKDF